MEAEILWRSWAPALSHQSFGPVLESALLLLQPTGLNRSSRPKSSHNIRLLILSADISQAIQLTRGQKTPGLSSVPKQLYIADSSTTGFHKHTTRLFYYSLLIFWGTTTVKKDQLGAPSGPSSDSDPLFWLVQMWIEANLLSLCSL